MRCSRRGAVTSSTWRSFHLPLLTSRKLGANLHHHPHFSDRPSIVTHLRHSSLPLPFKSSPLWSTSSSSMSTTTTTTTATTTSTSTNDAEMMHAVYQTEYGPPEVLKVGLLPKPRPGPRDLLVKVHAFAINPVRTLDNAFIILIL